MLKQEIIEFKMKKEEKLSKSDIDKILFGEKKVVKKEIQSNKRIVRATYNW
jgi:hypothetical protein